MNHDNLPPKRSIAGLTFAERDIGVECPKCQMALKVAYIRSKKVAGCSRCRGILVQSFELADLIAMLRAEHSGPDVIPPPIDQSHAEPVRGCPSCGGAFESHFYCGPGNVYIDSCIQCKMIWLDGGELLQIIEAPGNRD